MAHETFEGNPFTKVRGDRMKRNGVVGEGRLVHANEATGIVVVAWEGYSYNPGSHHSMLQSYAPAETAVYRYERMSDRGPWARESQHKPIPVFTEIARWQTRAPKGTR